MVSAAALRAVYPGFVRGHIGIGHRFTGLATTFVFQPQKFLYSRTVTSTTILNYLPADQWTPTLLRKEVSKMFLLDVDGKVMNLKK